MNIYSFARVSSIFPCLCAPLPQLASMDINPIIIDAEAFPCCGSDIRKTAATGKSLCIHLVLEMEKLPGYS